MELESMLLLAALVYLAGLVDSLAGGGGLITLPAYLALGLPPEFVLGTNKCSSTPGALVSAVRYTRHFKLSLTTAAPMVVAALIGSLIGAKIAVGIDPKWIRPILLCVLPAAAWAVLHKAPQAPLPEHAARLHKRAPLAGLAIGGYDGFFGPGTGTFLAISLHRFCGYSLETATGYAKILNLASNVSALTAFLYAGRVAVAVGLPMAAAGMLGHYTGSHIAKRKGAAAIRPALLLVLSLLFLKVLADALG